MKKLFYWCLLLTVAAVARPARAQQFSIAWKYAQKAGMKKEVMSPSQTQVEQLYIQQKSQKDSADIH